MADKVELPKNAELARQVLDAQGKERGMLGHIFGNKDHAPTNVAALAFVLLAVLLGITMFAQIDASLNRNGLVTAIISAMTFVMGLIFGRKGD